MNEHKTACITGGTRGIGLGIAQALAQLGWNLILCGRRSKTEVGSTLSLLKKSNVCVDYIQADLGSSDGVEKLLSSLKEKTDVLNILVNNAGVAPPVRADILETTEKSYSFVMDTNLKAPFFLTQGCARWMIEKKKKFPEEFFSIINISSISATVVSVSRGEYCISKAGMSMLTQLFAVRLGDYDIPVYEIRPGITKTDMTQSVTEKYDMLIANGLCVQSRWGLPSDVGKAVAMLVSQALPYSTGQVINVDGGLMLQRL